MIFTWFLHGCKFSIFPVINARDDQLMFMYQKYRVIKTHQVKMEDWFFQWITEALLSLVHGLSGWV